MIQNACKPAATPGKSRGVVGMAVRTPMPTRYLGNVEPSIDDLVDDEVVRRLMARDGIRREELVSFLDEMRGRLG